MIPFSEIISRVRTKFEAESSTRWSDRSIGNAINNGLDELSERTLFYERYVSIPKRAGQTYYDTRGYVPEGALQFTRIWSTTLDNWLDPINAESLNLRTAPAVQLNPLLWEESQGDPTAWFVRGGWWFGVYPYPGESASGYLRVYFASLAPHFTHPQSVLEDLPDDFVPALEDYALYELNAQDGETSKALLHWKSFSERAGLLEDLVEKRMQTNRVGRMGLTR